MAYKRKSKKLSLKLIDEKINSLNTYITKDEKRLMELNETLKKMPFTENDRQVVLRFENNIKNLQEEKEQYNKTHPFLSIFSNEHDNKILELQHQKCFTKEFENLYKYEGMLRQIKEQEEKITLQHRQLERLEKQATAIRKKNDKEIELKAAAAVNVQESRDIANITKRKLATQSFCPYCGGSLGSVPHADHIYPVSKGGQSVPKNMVYVCSKCNIMKSNLTLAAFIHKYGLDRDTIESRLRQLHKDF